MSKTLKKLIKDSKETLSGMVAESDLVNEDGFITALLGIKLEDVNISDYELQKILNDEGIYTITDLLTLIASEAWSDELGDNKENERKIKKIKKRIINY